MNLRFYVFCVFVCFIFLTALFVFFQNMQLREDNVVLANIYFQRESYLIGNCEIDYNEVLLHERNMQIEIMKRTLSNVDLYGDFGVKAWVVGDEGRVWGGVFGEKR
jgi:hypothetical protein